MRVFKLKTSRLALVFAIVTLVLHLGVGYLFAGVFKNVMLADIWLRSLKIYWPAMDLIQVLRLNVNTGFLMAMGAMILAALFELWVIFSTGIWLVRLYFRKPPISNVSKIAIAVAVLVVAVCFYKKSPVNLGDPRSPLELAMDHGDVQTFEKILKSKPSLANKKIWADNTPLNVAIGYQHPEKFIDLLVKYGADINAPGWPFDETPLQVAASEGKVEAVKAILAHHPDVNALHKEKLPAPTGYVVENTDETALSYAFNADSKEIFNLLLDAGADINHGRSALAECMIYGGGKDSWPEFLLSKGADPDRKGSDADRFVPIIQAILNGNTNYVAALLKYHVNLNTRYENGADDFSPLELAMNEGHMDIALMIQDYALRSQTNTVSFAAANGDLDLVRALIAKNPQSIEEKDDLGFTPLAWAAKAGQRDSAELLLSLGADPNAATKGGCHPIDWAASAGHLPLVELLVTNGVTDLNTALCFAINQKHVLVAKFLLEHGAYVDNRYNYGPTPLEVAASQGDIEAARLLLEHGASVNAEEQNSGNTPLKCAAGQTSREMVELLFAKGAALSGPQGYWTVFHAWALGAGDSGIADVLLSHDADINAKDNEGQTPLHYAARQGQIQAVEWLLKHGADVNPRDKNGKTPLGQISSRQGRVMRKDIADLLQKYGARE